MKNTPPAALIQELAQRCVKCGLCSESCPTYLISNSEPYSPRGRIEIANQLAQNSLSPNDALPYLETCLSCRACEKVCPAKVQFSTIIDLSRATHPRCSQKNFVRKLLSIFQKESRIRWGTLAIRSLQKLHLIEALIKLIPLKNSLSRLLQSIPLLSPYTDLNTKYLTSEFPSKGTVTLYTGCASKFLDRDTLIHAIGCLLKLGFNVDIPKHQTCCSALALHAGDPKTAHSQARQTHELFLNAPTPILTTASACFKTLKEYPTHPLLNFPESAPITTNIQDLMTFISRQIPPESNLLAEIPERVILHLPCTQQLVPENIFQLKQLLAQIPKLELLNLDHPYCCGGAGEYMYQQSEFSDALLEKISQKLAAQKASRLLTSNIGCALQIGCLTRQKQWPIKIQHPISLVYEAMKKK